MARAIRPRTSSRASPLPRPVLLGLFLLTSLATGVALSVVGPTVPAIAARLRVHESDLGLLFGANFLVATLTTPLAGRAFDAIGPRMLLPVGLSALALGTLGEGIATSLPLLTAAGALAGLGLGINTVCSNVTAGGLFPERRETVLNALNAFFGTGAFLAPLLAGFSLVHLRGYPPAYAVTALLLALPALPFLAGLPRGRLGGPYLGDVARGRRGGMTPLRTLLAGKTLWAHAAISFLYLGAEIGFGGWIVAVLQHAARLSPVAAAPIAALFWLFLALGGAPTAYLLRRGIAPARIVVAGAAGAALGAAALAAFGAAVPVAVVAAALVGVSFAPILPLNIAAVARLVGVHAPGAVGAATAIVLMAGQLGAAALPALQGLLLNVGPAAAMGLTCACSLLMVAVQRGIIGL